MKQKGDQPFTELLIDLELFHEQRAIFNAFKTSASWRYWLSSIHCFVFLGQFFLYILFIFHIPKLFSLQKYIFFGGSIAL